MGVLDEVKVLYWLSQSQYDKEAQSIYEKVVADIKGIAITGSKSYRFGGGVAPKVMLIVNAKLVRDGFDVNWCSDMSTTVSGWAD